MTSLAVDKTFAGSIPRIYDTYLVPMIFQAYARDLAARVVARSPARILEVAAGTGVVTRELAAHLPRGVPIIAIDLNQAMLDQAAAVGASRPVEWRQADVMRLPFADGAFDAVVCQFGVMFFPDKAAAFQEIRRVLAPGGVFLFNVWDRLADNDFADTVTAALATVFPADPPRFMARTPHGYHDGAAIERDLRAGGFTAPPRIATIADRSRAASARDAALAYVEGTPVRNEIEARDASRLDEATEVAAEALAQRFGSGTIDGKIQALVVSVDA